MNNISKTPGTWQVLNKGKEERILSPVAFSPSPISEDLIIQFQEGMGEKSVMKEPRVAMAMRRHPGEATALSSVEEWRRNEARSWGCGGQSMDNWGDPEMEGRKLRERPRLSLAVRPQSRFTCHQCLSPSSGHYIHKSSLKTLSPPCLLSPPDNILSE